MITAKIEKITPAKAKKLLELNTSNFRKIDRNTVIKYAKEITAGEWHLNGESIKISKNNTIIDGQHRLSAIIMAGINIDALIVRNVEEETARTIDRGKSRTVPQWLSHSGIKNANNIAAIAALCLAYKKGLWGKLSIQSCEITDSEKIDFVQLHNDKL